MYCLITDIVLPEDLQLVGGVLLQLGTIDHLQMQLRTGEGEMVDGVVRDCSCKAVMGDDSDYDNVSDGAMIVMVMRTIDDDDDDDDDDDSEQVHTGNPSSTECIGRSDYQVSE